MKLKLPAPRAIFPGILVLFFCGWHFSSGQAAVPDTIPFKRSTADYPSFYHERFTVDGKLTEWPSGMFYDNVDARILYAVSNDSSRMYFCLQILHQAEQMSVMHDGLAFRIEANGKKKESSLLEFPFGPVKPYGASPAAAGNRNEPQPQVQNQLPLPGMKGIRQKARRFSADIKLSGFREGFDGIFHSDSLPKNMETALAYDSSGTLVIEVAVPLAYFKQDLRMTKYVSLAFVIKGIVPASPQYGQGGGGGGGMQGGGGHGGGYPGGQGLGGGPGGGQDGGQGMGGGPGGTQGGGQGMGGGQGNGPPPGGNPQSETKNYKISHKFAIAPRP